MLTDIQMLKQPCNPEITTTWSWCIILFTRHWIQCASVLLRKYWSVVFSVISLSGLGIRVISTSWNDLEVFCLLIFGRVYVESVTITFKCLVELTRSHLDMGFSLCVVFWLLVPSLHLLHGCSDCLFLFVNFASMCVSRTVQSCCFFLLCLFFFNFFTFLQWSALVFSYLVERMLFHSAIFQWRVRKHAVVFLFFLEAELQTAGPQLCCCKSEQGKTVSKCVLLEEAWGLLEISDHIWSSLVSIFIPFIKERIIPPAIPPAM